jgi:hypothetical protein
METPLVRRNAAGTTPSCLPLYPRTLLETHSDHVTKAYMSNQYDDSTGCLYATSDLPPGYFIEPLTTPAQSVYKPLNLNRVQWLLLYAFPYRFLKPVFSNAGVEGNFMRYVPIYTPDVLNDRLYTRNISWSCGATLRRPCLEPTHLTAKGLGLYNTGIYFPPTDHFKAATLLGYFEGLAAQFDNLYHTQLEPDIAEYRKLPSKIRRKLWKAHFTYPTTTLGIYAENRTRAQQETYWHYYSPDDLAPAVRGMETLIQAFLESIHVSPRTAAGAVSDSLARSWTTLSALPDWAQEHHKEWIRD